jgi:Domain of unknown function (DUF4190)
MMPSDPEQPPHPPGAVEYPSLEHAAPQPYPSPPIDYPPNAGLPPPVYPQAYPAAYPGYAAPPGPYPGAYDPYRPLQPPGTNGMAIAALAVSVGALVMFCGVPSFIGVILGIIAMREMKRTGQGGFGMALAAIIVGAIPTVLWLLYVVVLIGIYASGWQWAP